MAETTEFDLVRMEYGGHPVLFVYGEIDVMTAPRLHGALAELVAEAPSSLLVDLANVSFVDSTGLGTLVVAHRHLEERGGTLRLVSVPGNVLQVLDVTGLTSRFHIFPDMESAQGGSEQA
ncbi:MAG: anti-sigma-factor antagonist [Acidimicrobiaceae bacterium]|nr:anti-sigma-factor antagonist [Acidimicrobiaceae bacterium]